MHACTIRGRTIRCFSLNLFGYRYIVYFFSKFYFEKSHYTLFRVKLIQGVLYSFPNRFIKFRTADQGRNILHYMAGIERKSMANFYFRTLAIRRNFVGSNLGQYLSLCRNCSALDHSTISSSPKKGVLNRRMFSFASLAKLLCLNQALS